VPKQVDSEQQRSEFADATWRVINGATQIRVILYSQAKPGSGEWSDLKPFVGTQRLTNSARKGWPANRKRVLRSGEVTHPAKRRQRVSGPCD
jgi:hypothetical protein